VEEKKIPTEISPEEILAAGNVRGTEYIYPERMDQIRQLRSVMYDAAEVWGYNRVDGPTMQPVEFYKVKSSDDLLKEGYYISSGDRTYMLRPETTPTVAYMLAKEEKRLTFPVRWYSDSDIYRNERPQSGRRRQFGQFNLDKFELSPLSPESKAISDAEVISTGLDVLSRMGLSAEDIVMRVNSRALLERLFEDTGIESSETRRSLLSVIDAKAKIPQDLFEAKIKNAGVNQEQFTSLRQWLNLTSLDAISKDPNFNHLTETEEYQELVQVFEWVKRLGYGDYCVYDPTIVRGLGYYTGTVFEAYDRFPEKSMNRSILGGGRYDQFTKKFGGKIDVTGAGFGIGHIPLETLLASRDLMPAVKSVGPEYYVATKHDREDSLTERLDEIMEVSGALRHNNHSVVLDPSVSLSKAEKIKKQLSAANKLGAMSVLIFFDNDENRDKVVVKDLVTGNQEELPVQEFLNRFRDKE